MSSTAEFLVLLLVSVLAHMAVAYVWAPRAATERLRKALRDDDEIIGLVSGRLGPGLEEWLRSESGERFAAAAVERVSERLGPALESWIRSDAGRSFVSEAIGVAAGGVADRLGSWFEGQAGAAARRADAKVGRAVVEDLSSVTLETGNPVLDGAWGLVPAPVKRKFLGRIVRAVRRSMLSDAIDVTGADVTDSPALAGPSWEGVA